MSHANVNGHLTTSIRGWQVTFRYSEGWNCLTTHQGCSDPLTEPVNSRLTIKITGDLAHKKQHPPRTLQ